MNIFTEADLKKLREQGFDIDEDQIQGTRFECDSLSDMVAVKMALINGADFSDMAKRLIDAVCKEGGSEFATMSAIAIKSILELRLRSIKEARTVFKRIVECPDILDGLICALDTYEEDVKSVLKEHRERTLSKFDDWITQS